MTDVQRLLQRDPRVVNGLRELGLRRGAVAYCGTDLPRLLDRNVLREFRHLPMDLWLEWLYRSVREVIGDEGTVVVPTFSYDYARNNTPYIHEESPSEVCRFSEYVRNKPGTVRSLHPLFSLSANGPAAGEICDDTGKSAYGACSAFSRLAEADTTFVFLGTSLQKALTYAHHLEHLYGVNHYMHKAFDAPVHRNGVQVAGPWLAFVRYLHCGIEISLERFEKHLRDRRLLRNLDPASGQIQAIACRTVHQEGLQCLKADPWLFINRPLYVRFRQDNLKIFDVSAPSVLVGYVS